MATETKHKIFVRKPTGQECPVYRIVVWLPVLLIVVSFSMPYPCTPTPIDGTFLSRQVTISAAEDNLEWIVVNDGTEYIFEGAIDPTVIGTDFTAEVGKAIGLAFHFNECENGTREHQIGWTPGGAWDAAAYGDLIFDAAVVSAVDLAGKLTTSWGSLKSQ